MGFVFFMLGETEGVERNNGMEQTRDWKEKEKWMNGAEDAGGSRMERVGKQLG